MNLKTVLILSILSSLAAGQFDDRLWLIQAAGAGPGRVYECDRDGAILNWFPGPQFGSGGVAKDLFLNRVWVCDDGAWNGFGQATGAIRAYEAGIGETTSYSLPGARAIAMLSGGDVAVLLNSNPLQPSEVQIVPWNSAGGGLPPRIPVGMNALQMVSGPNDVIWTLDSLSGTVSRIEGSIATPITLATSTATLDRLVLLPGGQILVTFQNQSVAAVLSPDGTVEWSLALPEAPLRIAADGDTSVFMIGASGQLYRINTRSAAIVDQFPLTGGSFGALIPAQRGRVWIEDMVTRTVTEYGFGGTIHGTITTPFATHTRGDPLGLEWASKTQPDGDVDGDGATTSTEIRRGTDALDGSDVPPQLIETGAIGGVIPMQIDAPGRPNRPFVLLASLSGARAQPLGPDGHSAPYYELNVVGDMLTWAMLQNSAVSAHFLGMPLGDLDGNGQASAAIDLAAFQGYPSLVNIYCCAVIFEPGFTAVSATTNPVCFDNTGTPCP